ncbi:10584_t:CDS:1, partial [Racocetra fulgida]
MECFEYNAITSTSNVKMKMTVLYPFHSIRFQKYLGPSGSNIKLDNAYLISGFVKFSASGKLMIEATEIEYLKTNVNSNMFESSSSISTQSIVNIIADNIESAQKQDHVTSSFNNKSSEIPIVIIDNDTESNLNNKEKQSNLKDSNK